LRADVPRRARRPSADVRDTDRGVSRVALVASIDRSEHVEVQYRIEDGRLVEAPVFMADIPTWDPDGSG
jgi:hypothetical protein